MALVCKLLGCTKPKQDDVLEHTVRGCPPLLPLSSPPRLQARKEQRAAFVGDQITSHRAQASADPSPEARAADLATANKHKHALADATNIPVQPRETRRPKRPPHSRGQAAAQVDESVALLNVSAARRGRPEQAAEPADRRVRSPKQRPADSRPASTKKGRAASRAQGGVSPKGSKSPSLPKSWQLVAHMHADDQILTKDVHLEVFGEPQAVDAAAQDDSELTLAAGGVTFAEAWRSFKQQEDVGFGRLRDYVSNNYVGLLKKILSPPRERYALSALGPSTFSFRGREIRRDDFVVFNDRDTELQCSLWVDDKVGDIQLHSPTSPTSVLRAGRRTAEPTKPQRFCVVYVHDFGGSRLASLSSLGVALDAGAAGYCTFDCTACGRSSGRHVSFGHYERFDVACVVAELVSRRGFTDVVLWGRGAGAVAALCYARATGEPQRARPGTLYDSVFSSKASHADGPLGYPERKFVQVDVLGGGAEPMSRPSRASVDRDSTRGSSSSLRRASLMVCQSERLEAVRRFVAGLKLEPLTWQWVVSKPPLVVTHVEPGSEAESAGVQVGDQVSGVGGSTRLPHTREEFVALLESLAKRERLELLLYLTRVADLDKIRAKRMEPFKRPAGIVLDCVVDSPIALINTLRDQAADREPILVTLLEPLLSSALDLLFHSVQKRANFDPASLSAREIAAEIADIPALFAVNDFFDVERGIPNLATPPRVVFDAYAAQDKEIVHYNAPLRLALRGSLDAMSSKFLNKSFVFLQRLPGFAQQHGVSRIPVRYDDREPASQSRSNPALPRWVVTTRAFSDPSFVLYQAGTSSRRALVANGDGEND